MRQIGRCTQCVNELPDGAFNGGDRGGIAVSGSACALPELRKSGELGREWLGIKRRTTPCSSVSIDKLGELGNILFNLFNHGHGLPPGIISVSLLPRGE